MVGVVGSSPIEPTNECVKREPGSPGFHASETRWSQRKDEYGEYGYGTANVYRGHFGATLVEEPFRLFQSCGLSK